MKKVFCALTIYALSVGSTLLAMSDRLRLSFQEMTPEAELISCINSNNLVKMRDLLTQGLNVNAEVEFQQHYAVANSTATIKLTPLQFAAQNEQLEAVQLLLAHLADPNLVTKHPPPIFLCLNIVRTSEGTVLDTQLINDILRALLEAKANPQALTPCGYTPLYRTLHSNNTNGSLLLLLYGADPFFVTPCQFDTTNAYDLARQTDDKMLAILNHYEIIPDEIKYLSQALLSILRATPRLPKDVIKKYIAPQLIRCVAEMKIEHITAEFIARYLRDKRRKDLVHRVWKQVDSDLLKKVLAKNILHEYKSIPIDSP